MDRWERAAVREAVNAQRLARWRELRGLTQTVLDRERARRMNERELNPDLTPDIDLRVVPEGRDVNDMLGEFLFGKPMEKDATITYPDGSTVTVTEDGIRKTLPPAPAKPKPAPMPTVNAPVSRVQA